MAGDLSRYGSFRAGLSASGAREPELLVGVDDRWRRKAGPFRLPANQGVGTEQWVQRAPRATIQSLLDNPQVTLTETTLAADGQQLTNTIKLSNDGFAFAMNSLMATCPSANNPAVRQAGGLPNGAAK
jgi:hypothetical protein